MKKMFALLSLCVLGCSTSGKTDKSGQPSGTEQPPPMQPAEPDEPVGLEQAAPPEMPAMPAQPAPAEVAPVQPAQPAASGNAEVCSAMCDRVAACQIASKELCMPACEPQVPQLTAEQRAQVIATMSSMACEDMAQFGAQGASGAPAAAAPAAPATDEGDDDGQDS